MSLRDAINDGWIHTKSFACLAKRAPWSVDRNRRDERCAIAPVLGVDVLHGRPAVRYKNTAEIVAASFYIFNSVCAY